jgi:hypothetical protein
MGITARVWVEVGEVVNYPPSSSLRRIQRIKDKLGMDVKNVRRRRAHVPGIGAKVCSTWGTRACFT